MRILLPILVAGAVAAAFGTGAWGTVFDSEYRTVLVAYESGHPVANRPGLDRRVFALETGMPIEAVTSRLGSPASALFLEESVTLDYGKWQLVLASDGLESRTKTYRVRTMSDERKLNRRIRRLRPGMSLAAVRSQLGRPEALEVYDDAPQREVGLWYGQWKLNFVDGILEGRFR